jgi:hypothetical protein
MIIDNKAVRENLRDAGCTEQTIELFIKQKGETPGKNHVLEKQRRFLLDRIHEYQKKLDCLDYLIYQLEKKMRSRKVRRFRNIFEQKKGK